MDSEAVSAPERPEYARDIIRHALGRAGRRHLTLRARPVSRRGRPTRLRGDHHLRNERLELRADNLASVRILEKVGMRREQHGVRDSGHAELGLLNGYTYALLADEWRRGAAP
jgi:hypothetical protein